MTDPCRTRRWRGVLAVVLGAGSVGLLTTRPSLLLLSTVGVVFAAYPWLTTPPTPALKLDRRLSEENPHHGDSFEVTTTVRNAGERPLFDLRIVDGVPETLSVTGGSPRHGTALRAGESATFSYTVEARHGEHAFAPATVVARDPGGAWEVETRLESTTPITCASSVGRTPTRDHTNGTVGRIMADQGGSGIEFYRTRSYRPGDPMRRIDWNRYARTGGLSTIEFREEQAATVVCLLDAREPAYRAGKGEPHAVAYGVAAAREFLDAILSERNRLGLGAFGREDCWLPPNTGQRHLLRGQRLLAEHAAFASSPPASTPDLDEQVSTLRSRLPDDAQILLFSPLCDDDIVTAARVLDAEGYPVSVFSVDVSDPASPGGTLAAIERENRIRSLRETGVPVIDWAPEDPPATAVSAGMEVSGR